MSEQQPISIRRRALLSWLALLPVAALAATNDEQTDTIFQRLDLIAEGLLPGAGTLKPGLQIQSRLNTGWLGINRETLAAITKLFTQLAPKPDQLDPRTLADAVAELDRACLANIYGPEIKQHWATLKMALMSIFYASKQGATEQLKYAPVPGRWLPDIPAAEATPYLSNDWLAMWFS